jgi:hypothetical protein
MRKYFAKLSGILSLCKFSFLNLLKKMIFSALVLIFILTNSEQAKRIIILNEQTRVLSMSLNENYEQNDEIVDYVIKLREEIDSLQKKVDILEREKGSTVNVYRCNSATADFQTNESFTDITNLMSIPVNLASTNRVVESFIDEWTRRENFQTFKTIFSQNKEIIDSDWSNIAFSNCNNMKTILPPYSLNNSDNDHDQLSEVDNG